MAEVTQKIALDDILEAAASGVLRAIAARGGAGELAGFGPKDLVASGFSVEFFLRCGMPTITGPGNPLLLARSPSE